MLRVYVCVCFAYVLCVCVSVLCVSVCFVSVYAVCVVCVDTHIGWSSSTMDNHALIPCNFTGTVYLFL